MFHFNRNLNKIRVFIERRNFLFFTLALVCLVISIVLSPKIFRLSIKTIDSFKDKKSVTLLQAEFEDQKESLEADLEKLQTDFGVEYEIRSRFPVVKEGEDMVVFVQNESGNSEKNDLSNESLWQKLKNLFK